MKKEKILKIVVALIMGIILLVMSTNVFAVSSGSKVDLIDGTNALGDGLNNTNVNTPKPSSGEKNELSNGTPNSVGSNNVSSNNYNTNLPKAGVSENTMIGVAVTVLAITAVYAYKKVNEYKNI